MSQQNNLTSPETINLIERLVEVKGSLKDEYMLTSEVGDAIRSLVKLLGAFATVQTAKLLEEPDTSDEGPLQ